MNVLVDTNILLDVLARRELHYAAAAQIWTLCEQGRIRGHVSVISFNNIYYVVRKLSGKRSAQRAIVLLRSVFHPVALDDQLLHQAIDAGFADFEDAIQYHSATRIGATHIITRNVAHFPKGDPPAVTAQEFLIAFAEAK